MGYGVKIFLSSPPNYVTRSPGYTGWFIRSVSASLYSVVTPLYSVLTSLYSVLKSVYWVVILLYWVVYSFGVHFIRDLKHRRRWMSRTFDCSHKGEPGNDVVATGVRDMIALFTDVVGRP